MVGQIRLKSKVDNLGRKYVLKNGMEQFNRQLVGKIRLPSWWTNLIRNLFEKSDPQIRSKIWWNNCGKKYCGKMGGQFGWTNLVE